MHKVQARAWAAVAPEEAPPAPPWGACTQRQHKPSTAHPQHHQCAVQDSRTTHTAEVPCIPASGPSRLSFFQHISLAPQLLPCQEPCSALRAPASLCFFPSSKSEDHFQTVCTAVSYKRVMPLRRTEALPTLV